MSNRTEGPGGRIKVVDNSEVTKAFDIENKIGKQVKVSFVTGHKIYDKDKIVGILTEEQGIYFVAGKRIPKNIMRNIQIIA